MIDQCHSYEDISAMKSRRSSLFLSSAKAGKAKVLCHATCQSLNHSTGAAVPSRDRTTTQRLVAPHDLKFRVSRALGTCANVILLAA